MDFARRSYKFCEKIYEMSAEGKFKKNDTFSFYVKIEVDLQIQASVSHKKRCALAHLF